MARYALATFSHSVLFAFSLGEARSVLSDFSAAWKSARSGLEGGGVGVALGLTTAAALREPDFAGAFGVGVGRGLTVGPLFCTAARFWGAGAA